MMFRILLFAVAETTMEKHSVVRAAVLDVSRTERLVDLSLKPEFVNKTKEENSTSKTLKKVCHSPYKEKVYLRRFRLVVAKQFGIFSVY